MFNKFRYSYLLLLPLVLKSASPFVALRMRLAMPILFGLIWWVVNLRDVGIAMHKNSRVTKWLMLFIAAQYLHYLLPFIYQTFGHGANNAELYGKFLIATLMSLPAFVSFVAISTGRIRELKALTITVIFAVMITGICAFLAPESMKEIGSARAAISVGQEIGGEAELNAAIDAGMSGLGGYTYMYSCAFIFGIALIFCQDGHGWVMKVLSVALALATVLNMLGGGLSTPFVVAAVGGICALGYALSRKKQAITAIGMISLFLLMLFTFSPTAFAPLSVPIDALADTMSDYPQFQFRLKSIADSLSGKGGQEYAYDRYGMQRLSCQTFVESGETVFVGAGCYLRPHAKASKFGGHSTICDTLAMQGLLGFSFLLFYYLSYKRYGNLLSQYYLGRTSGAIPTMFVALLLFAAFSNPITDIEGMLFVLMPGLGLFNKDCPMNQSEPLRRFYKRYPYPYA